VGFSFVGLAVGEVLQAMMQTNKKEETWYRKNERQKRCTGFPVTLWHMRVWSTINFVLAEL